MKNTKAVRLLLTANFISGIAQGISMISIPLFFQNIGAAAGFGIFYMSITLLSLLWMPYAGTLVDQYNRKHIFMWINGVCTLLVAILAGGAGLYQAWIPFCAAGVFATTFFNYNIHYPNGYAFMQEISEPQHYGRIASYIEIQGQLASMIAGGVAALLVEGVDWGWLRIPRWELWQIFAVNACTYAIAFVVIAFIRFVPVVQRVPEGGSVLERLHIGYTYLRQHPRIFVFGTASFSVFVIVMVHIFFLAPMYVAHTLDTTQDIYAWAEMLFALGAIFAGAAIQRIFRRFQAVQAITFLTLVAVGLYIGMAMFPSIILFLVASLIMGWSNAGVRVLRMSYLFQVIPNQVAGRANSIFNVINIGLRALFLALFALPLFHDRGVVYAFWVFVGFLLVSVVVMVQSAKHNRL